MSAQRKKSLESDQWVKDSSETTRAGEYNVRNNTNAPQHHTPEENDQSSSLLSNTDKLQPETCDPPSPDLTAKRRKLGSRRKTKERQHAKDSANELYHKPREEVEEITKGKEALETTQLPIQPERQEELSQGSKHDVSVTHGSSLYLASTSGYSCEVENLTTSCTEDIPEILSPGNGNQQGAKDENETGRKVTYYSCGSVETMQEAADKSETLQSEEVKENVHIVGSSDFISSGALSSEPLGVYSATEEENKESDEGTDLLRQDGNIKGNYLLSESHVESVDKEFFTTAEVTPDENNPRQIECSIEHATLPIEQLSADENQIERSSLPLDSQPRDSSVCIVEQMATSTVNRRKLRSSRRNKRQQVKDSVAESNREINEEVVENVRGYEVFETIKLSEENMLEEIDKSDTHQNEKLSGQVKEIAHPVGISESSSPTVHPAPSVNQQINQSNDGEMPHELPSVYSLTDAESKESDEVNVSHGKSDDLESPVKPEICTENSLGQLTEPECYVECSGVRGAEDAENKVHEEELKPAEMQEIRLIDDSTESVTHDAAENSEICFANLADQAEVSDSYQSESGVKSTAHSATKHGFSNLDDKQVKHPTLEGNKELLDLINEEYAYDHKSPLTSDIEIVDTAVGLVFGNEGQLEDEVKASALHTSDQKNKVFFSEVTESKSPTQTLQSGTHAPFDSPQDNAVIIDERSSTDFNPTGNRKKMGSSRRIKGRQNVRGSGPESKVSLTIQTAVQEILKDVMVEGNDKLDLSQTEEISDKIMENAQATPSGLTSISAHSNPPGAQQAIEQSNSRQMPEELASMSIVTDTESKELEEDTDLLRQWGILQAGNMVNETRLTSKSEESSVTPEITTEKNNHREHTEPKCAVEQATVSSPKEEMTTREENSEHFSSSNVRGAQHTQDAVEEVREDEAKPTRMQAMHQIDYSSSEESKSYLQTLQSDTKSPLDSQPMDSSLSIVDETPSVFKPTGNRRKLGSSRRNKGKQHVLESVTEPTEEVVERTCGDEEKMPFATETMRQEELKEQTGSDFKPTEKTRKIRSAVKEEENIDQTSDKDTTLSQNTMDSGNTVTTDKGDILKSSEEVNEVEEKLIKEPGHLTPRTGYDKVKMDLVQSAEASFWKDDSGTKNTSYHDDNVSNRPVAYDLLYQEEVLHVQNTEALPCDTDSLGQEMNMQHTNYVRETVGNVTIIDQSTEAETSMDAQGPGRVEAGEECKYPANKYLAAQGINTTNGVTHALLFSGAQNKTETMASFDIGHEENLKAMPAVNVSQESGISLAADSSNSRQDIQETPLVGNSDIMQGERREMGSTCKTQLNRKHEGETDNKDTIKGSNLAVEAGVRNLDRMEEVEELSLKVTAAASQKENANPPLSTVDKEQQEIYETGFVHDKWLKLQSSTSDLQTIKSNTIPDIDDSMALLPEQAASHNEVDVSPVRIVQRADVEDSEGNVDVSVEDFRSSELQTSSLVIGRKRQSINQLLPPNAEGTDSGVAVSFCETATGTQNDGQSPEGNKEIQDQASKSTESPSYVVAESVARGGAGEQHENVQASAQESSNVTEGAHSTDCEMKTEGSHLSSTNRRRKMGSTRRNLGSRSKVKDLHQKQEVDNNEATATKCGDLLTESASGIFEKEPQPHNEQKDSDSKQSREKVFETVEFRHTGESQVKPLAQQTDEEIPDSLSQLAETEHHQNPDYLPANPPTSSKHDDMSELAAGGRRRKMGSHRKSHGHQKYEDQSAREDRMKDAQQGRDVGSLTDERGIKKREEHGEEPSGMDRISEVDESDKKSPNISISNKTEHSRPLSEEAPKRETPVQHPHADIHLRQKSENKISLELVMKLNLFRRRNLTGLERWNTGSSNRCDSRGADVRSKSFNVLLVGNSSVGKTSFMKRAQSGKFSLDLAASVGLDSCMWTVVVDGKPVVLRLWDTAGQERFHSITTQVFHKAQAILLMYDITSSQSFSAVSYWANCIQEGAAEDVTIILLGNKSDCGERQVKTQEGEVLAEEYNFEFMECSAATGENVIHSLETVARMLSQMVDTRQEAMVLHKEPPQKKRSGCC